MTQKKLVPSHEHQSKSVVSVQKSRFDQNNEAEQVCEAVKMDSMADVPRDEINAIETLAAEIHKHNELYNAGKPEISDQQYDRLTEQLRKLAPSHPMLSELTTPDVTSDGKVVHQTPMLSLEKAEKGREMEQIANWLKRFKGDFIATPKIDGLACSIQYDEKGRLKLASTRGNGIVGENITKNALYIQGIPHQMDISGLEIRGEVYMPLTAFEAFDGEKRSARNLAVGGLKQKDAAETARYGLCFLAYDILNLNILGDNAPKTEKQKYDLLRRLGFTPVDEHTFERTAVGNAENKSDRAILTDIQAYCDNMEYHRSEWNFDADGLVFKVDDIGQQEELGATDHHPRCAIAYKFKCDTGITVLRNVEWQLAKGGTLTPVANFDPVLLAGAVVQRASLSNVGQVRGFKTRKSGLTDAEFNDNKREDNDKFEQTHLCIGAELLVSRRGDVIPHIEYVISNPENAVKVSIPDSCPSCGSSIIEDGLFLRCSDPDNCPSTGQALIENYAKVIGIMGLGEKIIESLYDTGLLRSPADLYRLEIYDIAVSLSQDNDGHFDENAILPEKLYTAIQNTRHIDLSKFLESISIPALGKVTSRILAEKYQTLDNLLQASEMDIAKTLQDARKRKNYTNEGIVETKQTSKSKSPHTKTAAAIYAGLIRRKELISDLMQYIHIGQLLLSGPFVGKSFLFTGTMVSMKREEAENRVKALGGTIAGTVKKDLSVLVATSKTTSKWKKAEDYNAKGASIQLLTEDEFLKMLDDTETANANIESASEINLMT